MGLIAALLALSDVLLAVVAFLWLARPEAGQAMVARLAGCYPAWQSGELSAEEEARLEWAADVARAPLLVLVLCWSFVVGMVLAWSRLP